MLNRPNTVSTISSLQTILLNMFHVKKNIGSDKADEIFSECTVIKKKQASE